MDIEHMPEQSAEAQITEEFNKAEEQSNSILEEKGYHWIKRGKQGDEYFVTLGSQKVVDVSGIGKSFEEAFEDAINNLDKKILERGD